MAVRRRDTRTRRPAASRRAREKARHEEEVLAAAERVFARSGFHGTGMAEIAREAEFSVGTLYNLFDSKEALIERLLLGCIASFDAAVSAAIEGATGALARLEAIAVAKARVVSDRRAFLVLFTSSTPGMTANHGFDFPSVQRAHARLRARIERVIDEGVAKGELTRDLDPATIALVFDAATRAHNVERVLKSAALDEAEVRAVARALLGGLAARPTGP